MTQIEAIRDNDVFTGREVKRMLRELLEGEGDVVISTTEAAELLGHSADWWRRAAPEIDGARREVEGGPWTLPLAGCRAHLGRKRDEGRLRTRRRDDDVKPFGRGPWKGRPAPQIAAVS